MSSAKANGALVKLAAPLHLWNSVLLLYNFKLAILHLATYAAATQKTTASMYSQH
jgi:hypothetical protein